MWWARASYLAGNQPPRNALYRHYYEEWLGRRGCLSAYLAAQRFNNNFTELDLSLPSSDHNMGTCGLAGVTHSFSLTQGTLNVSYAAMEAPLRYLPTQPYKAETLFLDWGISQCVQSLLSHSFWK